MLAAQRMSWPELRTFWIGSSNQKMFNASEAKALLSEEVARDPRLNRYLMTWPHVGPQWHDEFVQCGRYATAEVINEELSRETVKYG